MSEVAGNVMSVDLLERAEARRQAALARLDPAEQEQRGQYFTPLLAAKIISGLPRVPNGPAIKILDPGAGSGILTAALVDRLHEARPELRIHVVAVENDAVLHPVLRETLSDVEASTGASTEIVDESFPIWALGTSERFDIVIQNPPYAKLRTGSPDQNLLRAAGVTVPNIYAAFLLLGLRLLVEGGQQVAITPRSWMNGTYYSPFRREFVECAGIDAIHTFESRSKVFGDTGVLQESIVVSATRGRTPGTVTVFTSHDHRDEASSRSVAYEDIVTPDFIHVPASEQDADAVAWMTAHATHTLAELGLTVSTGRVVDFRSREMLHQDHVPGAVPMVNASHLRGGITQHPIGAKKPEWFHTDPDTATKLLVPGGEYVLIKRFSAKEERRRVVAAVWSSAQAVAFDNKLNYIHRDGHGLEPVIARGLAVFLNSTQLDRYFRVFSGHTQVNATDLRQMRFPSVEQLQVLARVSSTDQIEIDAATGRVLAGEALAASA
jgi:adenine-specific DNA-methyltransferase